MIPCEIMITNNDTVLSDIILTGKQDKVKADGIISLNLNFKILGKIRETFDQKTWERAYNKYDNVFRINIEIIIKSGRRNIFRTRHIRKAVLFWTRNPKIQYRIWITIIRNDIPLYPLSVDEARSILFDVDELIELKGSELKLGSHMLAAQIMVSWGKHNYTPPTKLTGKSKIITIKCVQ